MSVFSSAYFRLELIWWTMTFLLTAGVLLPIWQTLDRYPFYFINILYIVSFVTVTRFIFQLRFTFLAKRQILKIVLVFLCIPLVFFLVQELNHFQTFLDEEGLDALVGKLPYQKRNAMASYIHSQMLFFGVGSIISSTLFPFRLIVSVWRWRNRGTV